jgi:adenylate cyclase
LRATPVNSVYAGVEVHANMIAGILDRKIPQKPPYMLGAEVMLIAGIGLLLAIMIPMLSAVWATLSSFIAFAAVSGLSILAWTQAHTVLPLATSLLMILSLYVMNMAYGYFVDRVPSASSPSSSASTCPPSSVDKMAQDPEKYSMEGKEEQLTVLFSDVRGFTEHFRRASRRAT